jgi:hypothetical protein
MQVGKGAVDAAKFPPSLPIGSALAPLPSMLGCVTSSISGNSFASVVRATSEMNTGQLRRASHGIVH